MSRLSFTSTLIAVAIAGYAGSACGQQTGESELQQLQRPEQANVLRSQAPASGLAQTDQDANVEVRVEQVPVSTEADAGSPPVTLELVGHDALSIQGQEIGEITGLVRSRTGKELHAVVDAGGFLGIGERAVAVPVYGAAIDADGNLQVPLSRGQLEKLPKYDPQQYEQ
jgi:hypothetical protein